MKFRCLFTAGSCPNVAIPNSLTQKKLGAKLFLLPLDWDVLIRSTKYLKSGGQKPLDSSRIVPSWMICFRIRLNIEMYIICFSDVCELSL